MDEIMCPFDGVVFKEIKRHTDQRGWLAELFRRDELPSASFPVMGYISMTRPGRSRGPHEHKQQTDFFFMLGPSPFRIFLWDNRKGSKTYMDSFQFETDGGNIVAVTIPPGVVHGYKNIGSTDGLVFNAPDQLYAGENRAGPIDEMRYEDQPESKFKMD